MDSNTLILLNEAYRHGVYNEETLSEEEMLSVEEWVETLIDEGYDLDQYTDEELYEAYLEEKSTVMKVVSPKGEERSLNFTKASPSINLKGAKRRKAIQDISQERVDRSFADPKKVLKFRRRHGISEEVDLDEAYLEELYQGKHGQSATQYMAGRSDAGKRISGDDKTGPRFYTLGRSRGAVPDAPTQPGARPVNTPKMSKDEKTYHLYRKSESKKRTAAGYDRVGGSKGLPEELDLYDIVSEYLISEGFCDSYEDADVIMANMSEEWREDILEKAGTSGR